MEMKVQVPFQQLLSLIKSLTPSQKAKLRKELNKEQIQPAPQDDFISVLLNGPVYNENEILMIEENRQSITKWRTNV